MLSPAIPADEAERIAALHATRLLDTAPEEMFDRITRLAARTFGVSTALVSLVDSERQWFKSRHGLDACETPRSISFCGHALDSDQPLIIEDAWADPRFADNPLVLGGPRIRFYAGMPIHSIDRRRIGTLCLIDGKPRALGAGEVEVLRDLARTVEELIYKRQVTQTAMQLLSQLRRSERESAALSVRRAELERLLDRDALTGLPNQKAFRTQLVQVCARWSGGGQQGLVAHINLDNFKLLDGALGSALADEALAALASRLTRSLAPADLLARAARDEFLVMIDGPQGGACDDSIIERITDWVRRPIRVADREIAFACTIGYACYPQDGEDADALLQAANAAMQHARRSGGAGSQRYWSGVSQQAVDRITMEHYLRQALDREQLELHYQPKVDLCTGRVAGVEALVRWRHPDLGIVAPAEFIALAEETGLVMQLGEWVMHTACAQGRAWQAAGLGIVPVAVNLSLRQFLRHDLVQSVESAIRRAGLPPGALELELTESVSMGDPDQSAAVMDRMRELGVTLSIDDFGTGYSSLSYLKRLPIDKIKIDRSFVLDVTDNAESMAIVQAIIAMAHSLNLRVVAEGVETEAQLSFLARHHCDEIQGYLFSHPLPAADCTALLASGRCLVPDAAGGARPGPAAAPQR